MNRTKWIEFVNFGPYCASLMLLYERKDRRIFVQGKKLPYSVKCVRFDEKFQMQLQQFSPRK